MTTYVSDGRVFECNGRTFEGVNDVGGDGRRYLGFTCLDCGEHFSTDPDDHVCPPEPEEAAP